MKAIYKYKTLIDDITGVYKIREIKDNLGSTFALLFKANTENNYGHNDVLLDACSSLCELIQEIEEGDLYFLMEHLDSIECP